jgi:hypothetical protein
MKEAMFCPVGEKRLAGYLEGSLAGGERLEYERHVEVCELCREQLETWTKLRAMPVPAPSAGFAAEAERRWRREAGQAGAAKPWVSDRVAWAAMAAVLALVCGVGGYWLGGKEGRTEAALAQKDLQHLRSLMAVSLLQQQSAIERLRGVNYSVRLERTDGAVVEALLATLRGDSSVDVRLAAADALRKFRGNAEVRREMAESLPYQESPLLQMTLIDTLAEWRDPQAVRSLEQLAGLPETDGEVRKRIAGALAELRSGGTVR